MNRVTMIEMRWLLAGHGGWRPIRDLVGREAAVVDAHADPACGQPLMQAGSSSTSTASPGATRGPWT
jgi:hypothetical protein